MASSVLANRVRVSTATTGTGTVTLGAKVSNKYATFAEGGIANAQVVTYCIEDGNDWEIGRGTYTSAGTTLSRDTVLISSVAGTVGTSKLNLSGAAEVFISTAKEDFDVNDFTEDTSPDGTADYAWVYDASASLKKKVKPQNFKQSGGLQLLASGTVSAAATLDIVLTAYTGYRGIIVYLSGFLPVTDGAALYARFSTDGGASYLASGYNYFQGRGIDTTATWATGVASGSAAQIQITGAEAGNGATEGYNGRIEMLNQTSAAFWSRLMHQGYFINSDATPAGVYSTGGGAQETAQDTDAIRFLFSTGNISAGNYAVYGLI